MALPFALPNFCHRGGGLIWLAVFIIWLGTWHPKLSHSTGPQLSHSTGPPLRSGRGPCPRLKIETLILKIESLIFLKATANFSNLSNSRCHGSGSRSGQLTGVLPTPLACRGKIFGDRTQAKDVVRIL